MADLPAPLSRTDELLVALHGEVVGLRADLAAARGGEVEPIWVGGYRVEQARAEELATEPDAGQVELLEPKPATARPKRTRTTPRG